MLPKLRAVADDVKAGKRRWAKIKTLLSWFGYRRRGKHVEQIIREALTQVRLRTKPDFMAGGSVHTFLEFELDVVEGVDLEDRKDGSDDGTGTGAAETGRPEGRNDVDRKDEKAYSGTLGPALCIGMLEAADRPNEVVPNEVLTVTRNDTVERAIFQMLSNDYSQLPVTRNMRRIHGMISWRSIGRARTGGRPCNYVRDCLEDIPVLDQDDPLFEAVDKIAKTGVVLVRGRDQKITGIVTTSDLSRKYHELAEPFLLLQEIEDRIRVLIDTNFSVEEIRQAKHPDDDEREVDDASDLTFGEYVRLLGSRQRWPRLGLKIDRKLFVRLLEDVREVRNDVMHFSPYSSENLDTVRMLRRLLDQLLD